MSFIMFFQNLQMIYYHVHLTNQIAGLFDHQYLWKEVINVLDFLHRDIYHIRYHLRVIRVLL